METTFSDVIALLGIGFDDVDDEVAYLFATAYDVHVEHAGLVAVVAVLDVSDVQFAQLGAQGVDGILHVVGALHVGFVHLGLLEQGDHLVECLAGEADHLVDVLLLHVDEGDVMLVLAQDDAGNLVAGVADGLEFIDNAEQSAGACCRMSGDGGGVDAAQITHNLELEAVGNLFVLLDAREGMAVLGMVGGKTEEVVGELQHALATHGEEDGLLACLFDGEFGGAQESSLDEVKAQLLVIVVGDGQETGHQRLDLRNEADEHQGGDEVETGVEDGDAEGERCGRGEACAEGNELPSDFADGIDEHQAPKHAEEVEEQVAVGGSTGRNIGLARGNDSGQRGADIVADDEGCGDGEDEPFGGYKRHGKQDGGCRRAQDEGDADADEHKEEDASVAPAGQHGDKFGGCRLFGRRWHQVDEGGEAEDVERHTHQNLSPGTELGAIGEDEGQGQDDEGQRPGMDVPLETEGGDDPGRDGGAHIGSHHDGDALADGEETGVDEAYGHDGHGGRRLDDGGDPGACPEAVETIAGDAAQAGAHPGSCHLEDALAHHFHAIEAESNAAEEGEYEEKGGHGRLIYGS